MAHKKRKLWFILLAVSSVIYIFWRLFFTLPLHHGIVSLIAGAALFSAELISNLEALIHMHCISRSQDTKMPEVPPHLYPHVDVLIATHGEDAALLLKTVNGCCHMQYPDPSKVHIFLCDDQNRPEIASLAQRMCVGYLGLSGNKYAKAGNLNNALGKTHSPLVVTLDADMIPRREFLLKTVPYFFLPKMLEEDGHWRMRSQEEIDEGYRIGFVQTPQSFYNPDLFQFNFFAETNIPNEQDYFFREVNVGRNASNSAIYAGSNTVIAREALMEVGGIRTGTVTEDFATGIDIQAAGYTTLAIDTVLALGLAPTDFTGLLKQRQRWGRGCVQTVRSLKFWTSKLPLSSKLSYVSCLFYWWTFIRRFIYILAPILYMLFGIPIVRCSLPELLCIWLPSYLIYNHTLKLLSGKTRNQRWSNIVDTIICPYMILPILLETLGMRMRKFAVTNKENIPGKSARFWYALPHLVLLAAVVPGICVCARDMIRYRSPGSIAVLYWLSMNGYFLLMSVLFMTGRVNFRSAQRYNAQIPVCFSTGGQQTEALTCDISENGFSFLLDFPEYIPFASATAFTVRDPKLRATVYGKVVHVEQRGSLWKYSVQLVPKENQDYLEYLQIVYDREPSLATAIRTTAWKDLSIFTKKKVSIAQSANRRLPRILLSCDLQTTDGEPVTVLDFNYQYITAMGPGCKDCFQLRFAPAVILQLEKDLEHTERENLYLVTNWESMAGSPDLRHALQKILRRGEPAYEKDQIPA